MASTKVSKQTRIKYRTIAIDLGYSKQCQNAIMECDTDEGIQRILLNERKRIQRIDEEYQHQLNRMRKERAKYGKNP